ncbi:peptidylprolyl isomerase [Aliikangiella sp. G2MR2-5]|uniref:peptidylprolyl isomerase n=1 Tax=Aliikangiella sp. G2MR2-5 TaxID=2788943 RepID=UPI0018A97FA6|nr:peptidylprolyl isomerase [Aliikangiella sp. G2MR2-5]
MDALKNTILSIAIIGAVAFSSNPVNATIVQFETSLGNFEVNLYDEETPQTVANFLDYVNSGAYENVIIHRSVPGFVIQGGGFKYNSEWPVTAVPADSPVNNEPVYSNVKGSIAMAKVAGQADSATNQWFFNLIDNSTTGAALDIQNSGFTVFGETTNDGIAILEQIAALPRYDFSGTISALGELPLQNFDEGQTPDDTQLIIIQRISIIDAAIDTAAGLNPVRNTSLKVDAPSAESSGGGVFGTSILSLIGLWSLVLTKRKRLDRSGNLK